MSKNTPPRLLNSILAPLRKRDVDKDRDTRVKKSGTASLRSSVDDLTLGPAPSSSPRVGLLQKSARFLRKSSDGGIHAAASTRTAANAPSAMRTSLSLPPKEAINVTRSSVLRSSSGGGVPLAQPPAPSSLRGLAAASSRAGLTASTATSSSAVGLARGLKAAATPAVRAPRRSLLQGELESAVALDVPPPGADAEQERRGQTLQQQDAISSLVSGHKLQAVLDATRQELAKTQEEAAHMREVKTLARDLQRECTSLNNQLDEVTAQLTASQAREAEMDQQLAMRTADCRVLQERVEELTGDLASSRSPRACGGPLGSPVSVDGGEALDSLRPPREVSALLSEVDRLSALWMAAQDREAELLCDLHLKSHECQQFQTAMALAQQDKADTVALLATEQARVAALQSRLCEMAGGTAADLLLALEQEVEGAGGSTGGNSSPRPSSLDQLRASVEALEGQLARHTSSIAGLRRVSESSLDLRHVSAGGSGDEVSEAGGETATTSASRALPMSLGGSWQSGSGGGAAAGSSRVDETSGGGDSCVSDSSYGGDDKPAAERSGGSGQQLLVPAGGSGAVGVVGALVARIRDAKLRLQEHNDSLQAAIAEREAQVTSLKADVANLRASARNLEARVQQKGTQVEQLSQQLCVAEGQVEELSAEVAQMQLELTGTQAACRLSEDRVADSQQQIARLVSDNCSMMSTEAALQERLQEVTSRLSRAEGQVRSLQTTEASLMGRVTEGEQERSHLQQGQVVLEEQLIATDKHCRELQALLADSMRNYADVKTQLDQRILTDAADWEQHPDTHRLQASEADARSSLVLLETRLEELFSENRLLQSLNASLNTRAGRSERRLAAGVYLPLDAPPAATAVGPATAGDRDVDAQGSASHSLVASPAAQSPAAVSPVDAVATTTNNFQAGHARPRLEGSGSSMSTSPTGAADKTAGASPASATPGRAAGRAAEGALQQPSGGGGEGSSCRTHSAELLPLADNAASHPSVAQVVKPDVAMQSRARSSSSAGWAARPLRLLLRLSTQAVVCGLAVAASRTTRGQGVVSAAAAHPAAQHSGGSVKRVRAGNGGADAAAERSSAAASRAAAVSPTAVVVPRLPEAGMDEA